MPATFAARVFVTLKPTVNDPQGLTVMGGLKTLGFAGVHSVRVGKFLEIQLEAETKDHASALVDEMCRKLLANLVIEGYRFELEEVRDAASAS